MCAVRRGNHNYFAYPGSSAIDWVTARIAALGLP